MPTCDKLSCDYKFTYLIGNAPPDDDDDGDDKSGSSRGGGGGGGYLWWLLRKKAPVKCDGCVSVAA